MNIEHIDLVLPPDYPREIGLFLGSLEKVRRQWREAVEELSKDELARKIFPEVQPIGTLILHIAEAEYFWIQTIVSGQEMTDDIKNLLHWDLWFGDFASKNLDVRYCIDAVEKIHQLTLQTLAGFGDADLEKTFVRRREDRESHYTLRWIFVHLIEHEATHKGQIMMLQRLLREPAV